MRKPLQTYNGYKGNATLDGFLASTPDNGSKGGPRREREREREREEIEDKYLK